MNEQTRRATFAKTVSAMCRKLIGEESYRASARKHWAFAGCDWSCRRDGMTACEVWAVYRLLGSLEVWAKQANVHVYFDSVRDNDGLWVQMLKVDWKDEDNVYVDTILAAIGGTDDKFAGGGFAPQDRASADISASLAFSAIECILADRVAKRHR